MTPDTSAATPVTMVCPRCGGSDLATIERILGDCRGAFELKDGKVEFFGDGYTEIDWDSTESVGVLCKSCFWSGKEFTELITQHVWDTLVEEQEAQAEALDPEVGHA